MAQKLNTEFNYRYQVQGETIWEKIKTLQGFLEWRKRAEVLEIVNRKKHEAKIAKLKRLKETTNLEHEILELEADIIEAESFDEDQAKCFELNKQELEMLERLLEEAYLIAEPTRIEWYTDEQMFEANAALEFTTLVAREIQSEILCYWHPSPAKLKNAMSNPMTWNALQTSWLIPLWTEIIWTKNNQLALEPHKKSLVL